MHLRISLCGHQGNHLTWYEKPFLLIKIYLAMNKTQKQILTGLMLGDGCLEKHKHGKNACLRVVRKSTDKPYLMLHAKIFSSFNVKYGDKEIFDKRTNKTYYQCFLRTSVHPELTQWWTIWYSDFRKIVPSNLELTPLVLATWFADDGSIKIEKRIYDVKLATHGFTRSEVYSLQEKLKTIFNLNFKVYEDKSAKNPHWTLRLTSKGEVRKFVQIIKPVFPKAMKRKSDIWNKNRKLLEIKVYPNCKFCQSNNVMKNGSNKNKKQKYFCKECKRQFIT